MTAEIVPAAPTIGMSETELVWKLAQRLADTEFVPQSLRGRPNAVLAAILTGREMGIGPMQALQSINVIQGKPTLSPELMRALVYRGGHRIDVTESTDLLCTIKGVRADTGAEATVTWTMDDARRANLAGKGAWNTYPRAMLLARATSELCRLLFADVIAGVSYTPEEIGGEPEVVPESAPAPEIEAAQGDDFAEIDGSEDASPLAQAASRVPEPSSEIGEPGGETGDAGNAPVERSEGPTLGSNGTAGAASPIAEEVGAPSASASSAEKPKCTRCGSTKAGLALVSYPGEPDEYRCLVQSACTARAQLAGVGGKAAE